VGFVLFFRGGIPLCTRRIHWVRVGQGGNTVVSRGTAGQRLDRLFRHGLASNWHGFPDGLKILIFCGINPNGRFLVYQTDEVERDFEEPEEDVEEEE